jgi:hypothetical protein
MPHFSKKGVTRSVSRRAALQRPPQNSGIDSFQFRRRRQPVAPGEALFASPGLVNEISAGPERVTEKRVSVARSGLLSNFQSYRGLATKASLWPNIIGSIIAVPKGPWSAAACCRLDFASMKAAASCRTPRTLLGASIVGLPLVTGGVAHPRLLSLGPPGLNLSFVTAKPSPSGPIRIDSDLDK